MVSLMSLLPTLDLSSVLVLSAVLLLTIWLLEVRHRHQMPPGPFQWPVIGCLPQIILNAKDPLFYLRQLGQNYKGMFSLKMGSFHAVFISEYDILKEAFVTKADCFSGKPLDLLPLNILPIYKGSRAILGESGHKWKIMRRFAVTAMRDMGVGKKTLEERIQEEAQAASGQLAKQAGKSHDPGALFGMAVTNIICSIIFGDRYEYDNSDFLQIIQTMNKITAAIDVFDLTSLIAPVQKLPLPKKYILAQEHKNDLMKIVLRQIKQHEEIFDPENINDLIDLCLEKERNSTEDRETFSANGFCQLLFELFLAGAETTSTTLRWSVLYLIENPEVQEKCHKEIDEVLGSQLPAMSHRPRLPYVDATIAEIQRLTTIAPLAGPHTTAYETTLNGYKILKGTWIWPMLYAINLDTGTWSDPECFRPERFLDAAGVCNKPEKLVPFGLGPRLCAGEPLARMELFLFFTTFLQKFRFSKVSQDQTVDFTPILGITQSPKPQNIMIHIR